MLRNVGGVDRWLRIAVGLVLIAGAFVVPGAWRWIAAPGTILIVTAVVRFCPAYWLLRIRTLTGRAGAPG